MTAAAKQKPEREYSWEEYLEYCEVLDAPLEYYQGRIVSRRGEFRDGQIVGMTGSTPLHGQIINNIGYALRSRIDAAGKDCIVYGSGVVTRAEMEDVGYQPDVTVVCGPLQTGPDDRSILNPAYLFEVSSPSTRDMDLFAKLKAYIQIESVQAYIIVEQHSRTVRIFRREDENIALSIITDKEKDFLLDEDFVLSLDEIYHRVDIAGSNQ